MTCGTVRAWGTGVVWLLLACVATGCGPRGDEPSIAERQRKELDPVAARLLVDAQQAYRRGSFHTALQLADSTLGMVPDLIDAHFLKGLVLADVYRFEDSREAFRAVLETDPRHPSVHFNLGNMAFSQAEYRQALRHYRDEEVLVEQDARHAYDHRALSALHLQIGRTYAYLGRPDSARQAYGEALQIDSTQAQVYAWIAESYAQTGENEEALAAARKALAREPNATPYQYLVGSLLVQAGQAEEAIPHLEAVIEAQHGHAGAHYNLGRAFLFLGRTEEGERYLARADTLQKLDRDIGVAQLTVYGYPEDPVRWQQLAYLLEQAGRMEEARKAVRVLRYLGEP